MAWAFALPHEVAEPRLKAYGSVTVYLEQAVTQRLDILRHILDESSYRDLVG
jgi:hypothetical protein